VKNINKTNVGTLDFEAEFLGVIGTKVFRVFLLAFHSHLYQRILLLRPS
jgi:hypothetical protein